MDNRRCVVGYVRVSTGEQGVSGLGLEAQRTTITAECARRGWTLSTIETDIASGGSMNSRPGLDVALGVPERGEASALVVAKLDRLSRSLPDFAGLLQRSAKAGWAVVAVDLGVDTTTASGRLVANVMASVAEWERDVIAQRTREALAVARARGVTLGRPREMDERTRRRIRQLRGRGWSFRRIAERLTVEGVPTAHGATRWHPSTVRAAIAS